MVELFATAAGLVAGVIAQVGAAPFERPELDWHAAAPELILLGGGAFITLLDIIFLERAKQLAGLLTGFVMLAAMIPIVTLANSDAGTRFVFNDGYVVDDFSLVLKAMFLLTGYVVVLLATNYIAEGDYWESEYYTLLLSSILGMVMMASSRDLITVFVALELLSIPAYMMAAWRKRDLKSNEAGLKYYLMGVFASAVLLYGMSLLYGFAGTTNLSRIGVALSEASSDGPSAGIVLGVIFVIVGFAFKVSAVPFHTWAPDTYEGAPTPTTAFLATASKAAGFVALMIVVVVAFYDQSETYSWALWGLAIATMTLGNLVALRQDNVVRMMAYSGVAQGGYMLAALAVVHEYPEAIGSVVSYLLIYMAMNLGVFAVVLAVSRKTGSAQIESFGGMIKYAPGLTGVMTIFLFALAGIPPLGGWFAKFGIFVAVVQPGTWDAYLLATVIALNSVIALFYYARVARYMWMEEVPDGDEAPLKVPVSLHFALSITTLATLAFGIWPQITASLGDAANDLCQSSAVAQDLATSHHSESVDYAVCKPEAASGAGADLPDLVHGSGEQDGASNGGETGTGDGSIEPTDPSVTETPGTD